MIKVLTLLQTAKARLATFLRKVAACLPRVSKTVDDVATELEKN